MVIPFADVGWAVVLLVVLGLLGGGGRDEK